MTLVTPPVNPVNPPSTFAEKDDTLFTTDAANAEPGMVGMEIVDLPPPELPTDVDTGIVVDEGAVVDMGRENVGS